jgi:hypothetical protein
MSKVDRLAAAAARRAEPKRSKSEAALNRAASIRAAKDEKLAAAKSALEAHGKEIAARIQIADKALAELKDKAGGAFKSFVDHRAAIAKMLADAKDECKAAKVPFTEFQAKYAPNFSRALTYELLAIGHGKLTLEDRTAKATARKRKSRAEIAERRATVETLAKEAGKGDEDTALNASLHRVAEVAVGKAEPVAEEPGIPEPPEEPPMAPPRELSAEEISDGNLAEWKRETPRLFAALLPADIAKARTWFNSQRWGVVPVLKDGRKAA